MNSELLTLGYTGNQNQVHWAGYRLCDIVCFRSFLVDHAAPRLFDYDGRDDFQSHLRGLTTSGFGQENIEAILQATTCEERDWVVGEAIAEAWLSVHHRVTWPWNMERDKRTPKASLPGVDMIGFIDDGEGTRLLLGEVKTSGEERHPPQVMIGRSGMQHQLDVLAQRLDIIAGILKWLWPRCKNTEYQQRFDDSVRAYVNSGNKAVSLFGVLIRDTTCTEQDLRDRGIMLGNSITYPTSCSLIALYLPCKIAELPYMVQGGAV